MRRLVPVAALLAAGTAAGAAAWAAMRRLVRRQPAQDLGAPSATETAADAPSDERLLTVAELTAEYTPDHAIADTAATPGETLDAWATARADEAADPLEDPSTR